MPNELMGKYEQFIQGKGKKYWAIAKQVRFGRPEEMVAALKGEFSIRAGSNYRYLGMLSSTGQSGQSLQLTAVGHEFINSAPEERQNILDHQILKFWLKNSARARAKAIGIFPVEFLIRLLLEVGPITFEEYKTVVIWVHPENHVAEVASLLAEFRSASKEHRDEVVLASNQAAGVDDFDDNIDRLYDLYFSASYFVEVNRMGGDPRHPDLALATTPEFAASLIEAFDSVKPSSDESYESWDQELTPGLPSVDEIQRSVFSSAADAVVKPGETPGETFIPIETVEPHKISIAMSSAPPEFAENSFGDRRSRKKADYLARSARLANVGHRAEQVLVVFEQKRLSESGRDDLAERVHHLSEDTDSHSFDVLSFNLDGSERHIEVKGVRTFTPVIVVFISVEEVRRALEDDCFSLVFVFDYADKHPLIYEADELLTLVRENLDPSKLSAGNMLASPLGWELRFAATGLSSADLS